MGKLKRSRRYLRKLRASWLLMDTRWDYWAGRELEVVTSLHTIWEILQELEDTNGQRLKETQENEQQEEDEDEEAAAVYEDYYGVSPQRDDDGYILSR